MAANDDTQPVLTPATKKVTITLKKFNPEVWLLEDASQKRCLAVIITLHASFTTIMTTSSETTTLRSANFKAEECAILTRQAGVRDHPGHQEQVESSHFGGAAQRKRRDLDCGVLVHLQSLPILLALAVDGAERFNVAPAAPCLPIHLEYGARPVEHRLPRVDARS